MIHAKAWLIPVFLMIAFLEYWLSVRQGKEHFTQANTAMNLTIGAIDQVFSLFGFFLLFLALEFVYNHFRIFTFPQTWPQWVLAYLAVDFVSYWYHRYSHEINILWAGHITHHSSGHFNFTNGFRTSPLQGLNRIPFWLILPVLGFSPYVLVFTLKISGLFDFLQHTQSVPKLGFLERIFITPSLHRVHHGKNDLYIDKNFGSTFSVWDQMFGTYQEETETVVFGLKDSEYEDSNPWKAVYYQYHQIWKKLMLSPDWRLKLKYVFNPPSWKPKVNLSTPKTDPKTPLAFNRSRNNQYALIQLVCSAISIILLLAFQNFLPVWAFLLFALSGIAGMVGSTLIFNQVLDPGFRNKEQIRLLATTILCIILFFRDTNLVWIPVLMYLTISFFLTLRMHNVYSKVDKGR